jgi:hypothetical protein
MALTLIWLWEVPLARDSIAPGKKGGHMSKGQRLLTICALVVIGAIIPVVVLDWDKNYASTWIVIFEREGTAFGRTRGISTQYGLAGALLGTVAPLTLFATAAFFALGQRWRS